MGKITFDVNEDRDNIGRANLNDKTFPKIPIHLIKRHYLVDNIYVVPSQFAHACKVVINGDTYLTYRLFVLRYFRENDRYEFSPFLTTLDIGLITHNYIGEVTNEPAPEILATRNDDGHWISAQSGVFKRIVDGRISLSRSNDNCKVSTPFAIQAMSKRRVYRPKLKVTLEGNFMEVTRNINGDAILDLETRNLIFWKTVPLQKLNISNPEYITLSNYLPRDFPHSTELCL